MDPFNNFFNNNNDDNNDDNQNQNNFNMMPIIPPNYAVVKNDKGAVHVNKVGFSFTCLIFGLLPAIFRADWYNLFCMLGIEAFVTMFVSFVTGMNIQMAYGYLGLFFEILWGFCYNFMYFRHLQNLDFKPIDSKSAVLLKKHHYFK